MAVRSQFSSSFPHSDPRPNSVGKQSRVIDANAETPKVRKLFKFVCTHYILTLLAISVGM
jgi:hypothetical protein